MSGLHPASTPGHLEPDSDALASEDETARTASDATESRDILGESIVARELVDVSLRVSDEGRTDPRPSSP
ncbi:MAG: hypothetical protein U0414_17705 [Polyangiaceae bacterium]